MKQKSLFLCGMLIGFLVLTAKGQLTDSLKPTDLFNLSLEELLNVKVKVSTTLPTKVFNSPSAVSVIDRELIDQYNFINIAEAIRQVAGIEILQTVIDKNVPTIRGILQNFYANKVLIMINNIPVWNPTYGNSSLDRISISDVERIEVLKGPASVLYGTNAYNGVINIILRSLDATSIHAQIDAGYPNFGSASLNYGEKKGDFSWAVSGHSSLELRNPFLMTGGADTLKIGNTFLYENDTLYYYQEEMRMKTLNVSASYKSHTIFLNNFINSYTHPGVNATYKTGANRTINDRGTLLSYAFDRKLSDKTHLRIHTYYDYHYRNQIMSQAVSTSARYESYRVAASAKINHSINPLLNIELGAEVFNAHNMAHEIISLARDTLISENIKIKKDIIEGSLFSQLNFNYKWLSLLGGIRFTNNNNFGWDASPRLSAIFALNNTNKLKLVYGHSFRAPNLLELYFDHWTVVGNPNLMPEKSKSFEFIYLAQRNKFFSQLTAYHSIYSNLIQRVRNTEDPAAPASYENANKFEGFGIEIEARYQNPRILNAFLSYNYINGNEKGQRDNFKYIPKHTLSVGLNKPIRQFFISSNAYIYSQSMGSWEEIPTQLLWDAHLGYKHKSVKGLKIIHTLSMKNLSNSDMLIPEYIRQRPQVNELATTGFGRRFIYSLKLAF